MKACQDLLKMPVCVLLQKKKKKIPRILGQGNLIGKWCWYWGWGKGFLIYRLHLLWNLPSQLGFNILTVLWMQCSIGCLCFVWQVKDPFVASRETEADKKDDEEEAEDGGMLYPCRVISSYMLVLGATKMLSKFLARVLGSIKFLCCARLHWSIKSWSCAWIFKVRLLIFCAEMSHRVVCARGIPKHSATLY